MLLFLKVCTVSLNKILKGVLFEVDIHIISTFNSFTHLDPQISSISPQPTPVLQETFHHTSLSIGSKVGDAGRTKIQEQQQHSLSDDLNAEPATHSGLNRPITEDELKASTWAAGSSSMAEVNQFPRDFDLSPGQILQPSQQSASLGVIGRRSVPDLGVIGDNVSASVRNSGATQYLIHHYQMLQAAYQRLPQPIDSERVKNYAPRNPVVTPASFPQAQAPIVANPAFWERFSFDSLNPDLLFFAFYYQQNTYQQYLAARELKRQSWRYHKKFNTWFQRHEEPEVTTDEYERGSYLIFDIHGAEKGSGWCQKITNDFTFEYNYLEDELPVLRWLNYLRPDIKRGNITQEEEDLIIRLHKLLGNRWSLIAGRLPGRTDNEIKNYWNTYLRKKVYGGGGESSPKAKKRSSPKHKTESSEDSSVKIVRTKAVRCTRSLFADLAPNQILDQDVGGFCTMVVPVA